MSGKLKEVRLRIASVKSTQQITKAMKMVSAAKLKRATDSIIQMRPYSDALNNMLRNVMASLKGEDIELNLNDDRAPERVMIILISSDRGLCGGFNSNLIKMAKEKIYRVYKDSLDAGNLRLMTIGKKATEAFAKSDIPLIDHYAESYNNFNFDITSNIAKYVINTFLHDDVDRVEVVYSKFKNAATQEFTAEQFLPIEDLNIDEDETENPLNTDYIFEPNQKDLLNELAPTILQTQFHRFFLDNNASEHGARMTAMDKATENANELLNDLKISYNRARQAAITTELTEIVSGAAALEGGS